MKGLENLYMSLKDSVGSTKSLSITITTSFTAFLLMALSTNIEYSIQMISSGLFVQALKTRIASIQLSSGFVGLILSLIYSFLIGATLHRIFVYRNTSEIEWKGVSGILPAVVAGGCASCGIGLLAFIGVGGVLASIPFAGNLLRVAGIGLLALILAYEGKTTECEI